MQHAHIALLATVAGGLFMLAGCSANSRDYDRARYAKMESVILASTNRLAGLPLAEASKRLGLDGVRWDEIYSNEPDSQGRLYHFDGFYLTLHLIVRPVGVKPGEGYSSRGRDELLKTGSFWVGSFWPHLVIDRLTDPKLRMTNYWDNLNNSFK